MSADPFPCKGEQSKQNREVIESARTRISTAQLIDLRRTAHRFKHLPFTRLVEALFFQTKDRGDGGQRHGSGVKNITLPADQVSTAVPRSCGSFYSRSTWRSQRGRRGGDGVSTWVSKLAII